MGNNQIERKVLGIIGAGGLAREVLELAKQVNKAKDKWEKYVFIDRKPSDIEINGSPVYTYELAKADFGDQLEIVLGIGEPSKRERLFKEIKNDGIPTPSLIHPEVYIPTTTTIGLGVVIQQGCFISCNVIIDDNVFIQPQCNIGHDDVLEEGCVLAGFSNVGGLVHIGKYSYIGLSSAIKQTVSIGYYSVVGMGSMVHKDIPDEMIAMGNPARIVAKNEEKRIFGR